MSAGIFRIRDVEVHTHGGLEPPPPSRADRIYLFKTSDVLTRLCRWLDPIRPQHIVELGIHDGGSVLFWGDRYRPVRMSAFDISPDAPHLRAFVERHGLSDAIRLHFGVSQTEADAIALRMARDFAEAPIDLVIDDASHQYRETRASFELLFPYLRAGGAYVIEDWAWGHSARWPADVWAGLPPMSPLIAELNLVLAGGAGLIDSIHIDKNFAIVMRGGETMRRDRPFRLEDHYVDRGFRVRPG